MISAVADWLSLDVVDVERLMAQGGVVAGILLSIFGISSVFAPADPVKRRLRLSGAEHVAPSAARLFNADAAGATLGVLAPSSASERSRTARRLASAGYRSENALRNYYLVRAALGAALPALLIVVTSVSAYVPTGAQFQLPGMETPLRIVIIWIAALMVVGFYGPTVWIGRRIVSRRLKIAEAFPNALDMLQISVEAGLGFDAALSRVGREFGAAHPELAEELNVVSREISLGRNRDEALLDFARRCEISEIEAFVNVLLQSMRFGASISDAIEVYSTDMRQKRMLVAEEKANKLPVLMSGILALLMLPAMLTLALGPIFIRAIRVIFPLFS